jgi:hypothetical protein
MQLESTGRRRESTDVSCVNGCGRTCACMHDQIMNGDAAVLTSCQLHELQLHVQKHACKHAHLGSKVLSWPIIVLAWLYPRVIVLVRHGKYGCVDLCSAARRDSVFVNQTRSGSGVPSLDSARSSSPTAAPTDVHHSNLLMYMCDRGAGRGQFGHRWAGWAAWPTDGRCGVSNTNKPSSQEQNSMCEEFVLEFSSSTQPQVIFV